MADLPLEAYKITADMLKKDDNLTWQQNSLMIALNGGLLTVIGILQPKDTQITHSVIVITLCLCLMGVVISAFWFLITNRIESFYNHWCEHLIYLEKKYLDPVRVFTIANEFFEKKRIVLDDVTYELRFFSRIVKIFTAIKVLAIIFVIIWILMGVYFIGKL